jgi:hypothetical protein
LVYKERKWEQNFLRNRFSARIDVLCDIASTSSNACGRGGLALNVKPFNFITAVYNGGLPVGSGTLTVFDLDPKILDFRREIGKSSFCGSKSKLGGPQMLMGSHPITSLFLESIHHSIPKLL